MGVHLRKRVKGGGCQAKASRLYRYTHIFPNAAQNDNQTHVYIGRHKSYRSLFWYSFHKMHASSLVVSSQMLQNPILVNIFVTICSSTIPQQNVQVALSTVYYVEGKQPCVWNIAVLYLQCTTVHLIKPYTICTRNLDISKDVKYAKQSKCSLHAI